MTPSSAVVLQQVGFTYAALQVRPALSDINLTINEGEIFGFLGPNGSGKTTLFGIVATLLTPTTGRAELLGLETRLAADALRAKIGVVFQKHSLDQKLSVSENLRHHGHLYGMWGQRLHQRIAAVLAQFDLKERAKDRVETLSEGLKRRTELAKVFVHDPRVFILDEPTAGLDPRARLEFWKELKSIHMKQSCTILVTTHLMDEAEHCQRLAFLNQGKLAAVDTPGALKEQVQGSVITIRAREPNALYQAIQQKIDLPVKQVGDVIRIECPDGHRWIPRLVESFPNQIEDINLSKPTLEDVFIHVTGAAFDASESPAMTQ